jgi:hypothetical protein
LVAVIDFIMELTRHNQFARQAALEGGFLDMLLRIYVVFPISYKSDGEAAYSVLLSACQSAISVLSADAFCADLLRNHPVYDLWLRGDQLTPYYVPRSPEEILEDRGAAWRITRARLVKRRLMIIWSVLSTHDNVQFQTCADVVEFSR